MILLRFSFSAISPVPFKRVRARGNQYFNDPKYVAYKTAVKNRLRGMFPHLVQKFPIGSDERKKHIQQNKYLLLLLTFEEKDNADDDNFRKTIQDALQESGIVVDDRQIRGGFTFTLVDKKNPRIELALIKLPDVTPAKLLTTAQEIFKCIEFLF